MDIEKQRAVILKETSGGNICRITVGNDKEWFQAALKLMLEDKIEGDLVNTTFCFYRKS
jgi:hypothetical protein